MKNSTIAVEIKNKPIQVVAFDQDGKILSTMSVNSLRVPYIELAFKRMGEDVINKVREKTY